MPPKTTLTELNEAQVKFLFSVLKNCDEVKPDWNAVAQENGIGYARNASGRFKDILKKLGYRYEAGKVFDTDNNGTAPSRPARAESTADKSKSASGKKRKTTAEGAERAEDAGTMLAAKKMKQEVEEHVKQDIDHAAEAE